MIFSVTGGGGESPSIKVITANGATVAITNGEDSFSQVATNGVALFESVAYGEWTITATLGAATNTTTFVLVEENEVTLNIAKPAIELQIGEKIKLDGIPYVIKTKNGEGYPDNTITVVSEYGLQEVQEPENQNAFNYRYSTLRNTVDTYNNELTEETKNALAMTTYNVYYYQQEGGSSGVNQWVNTGTLQNYLFVLSGVETGVLTTGDTNIENIGFSSDQDRICYNAEGEIVPWFLREGRSYKTTHTSSYQYCYRYAIANSGAATELMCYSRMTGQDPIATAWLRLAGNVLGSAMFALSADGYYVLSNASTANELQAKALSILGVEL